MHRNDTSLLQVPIDSKSGSPQADLRLAFWASIGFKPGSFHDRSHEREAICVALPRSRPSYATSVARALQSVLPHTER